ncbi:hypothetical protein CYLTODRAFT_494003 [Cylindrobasidium torrendii FP15055 ss-10]|uniref:Uncharacterized protein n=1 Tax=Cylindrobasidium torrendii FP15055 ss-10 TaxID=1314674 RepID=A0A0D7B1E6_9AGAR|nr:hypothetical protein CYLTODRAFT_494003 [Cylindrobasidium torrendii FP15055 ss-10]
MSRRDQPHRAAHVPPGTYAPPPNPPVVRSRDKKAYHPSANPKKRAKRVKTPEIQDKNTDFDSSCSKDRLKIREGPDCAITRTPENKDISIFHMDYVTRAHFLEKHWPEWIYHIIAFLLNIDVTMIHVNSSYHSIMLSRWLHIEVDAGRLLVLPISTDAGKLLQHVKSGSKVPFFELFPEYSPNSSRRKTRFMLVSLNYKDPIHVKGDPSPHFFPYSTVVFESYLIMPVVVVKSGLVLHRLEVFSDDPLLDDFPEDVSSADETDEEESDQESDSDEDGDPAGLDKDDASESKSSDGSDEEQDSENGEVLVEYDTDESSDENEDDSDRELSENEGDDQPAGAEDGEGERSGSDEGLSTDSEDLKTADSTDVQPRVVAPNGPTSLSVEGSNQESIKPQKDSEAKGPHLREGWTTAQCRAALLTYLAFKHCLGLVVVPEKHAFFDPEGEANMPTIYQAWTRSGESSH